MKDSELEKMLRQARVPERSAEYWDDFPRRALSKSRLRPEARSVPEGVWLPRIAWGLGVAFACLVIGLFIQRLPGTKEVDAFALLRDQKLLREVLTMFPNRVRAIQQDEHGVRLVLSENADVPPSPPLWVKICDGKHCRAVVTFSGQELDFAGEKVEVLADAQGQIMLVGNRFVWSSGEPQRATDHLRIQARALAYPM